MREAVTYFVFLGIFCVVVFAPRNSEPYELNRYFFDTFVEAEYHPGENYASVTEVYEFYRWIEDIFLPNMYPTTLYNGDPVEGEDLLFTTGGWNRRVGKVRLRQSRVRPGSCSIPDVFKESIEVCYGRYSESEEETSNYLPVNNYLDPPSHLSGAEAAAFDPTFVWHSADDLDQLSWEGKTKTKYGGGGYVFDLDGSYANATSLVQWLKDSRWIDEATRAVFIDFSSYNVNVDMFCVARMLVEVSPTGQVVSSQTFRTLPLISPLRVLENDGVENFDRLLVLFELVLNFFVFYYVFREYKMYKLLGRARYFTTSWNVLEIINLALFLCTLFLRCISWKLIGDERPKMNDDEIYVNLLPVSYFAQMVDNVNAFNAVLCFIKVFKYLRANKKLGQFTDTLAAASAEMVVLCVIIFIVVIGYAVAFHMAFGHTLVEYKDLPESIFSLFRSTLGDFDLESLREVNRYLGPLLFVSFMILMFFVIVSMFLSIVDNSYEKVRENLKGRGEDPLTRDVLDLRAVADAKVRAMLGMPPSAAYKARGASVDGGDGIGGPPDDDTASMFGKVEEELEMTVDMREQEQEVIDRLLELERQQTALRELLKQISDGIAP